MASHSKHSLPLKASQSCLDEASAACMMHFMAEDFKTLFKAARMRKGLTQQQVADELGVTRSAVGQWEAGTSYPATSNLMQACAFVGLEIPPYVMGTLSGAKSVERLNPPPQLREIVRKVQEDAEKQAIERFGSEHEAAFLPVYGVVAGGTGVDFYTNGEIVDYIKRPDSAAGQRARYALYVVGDSMVPRFEPGETVYVNPQRPPSIGDYVVIELDPLPGERAGQGYIKRLTRRTHEQVTCEQFNPPKSLDFPTTRIKSLHRIIPWNELLS